jgi:transcriptional regulator of arginine metabolism
LHKYSKMSEKSYRQQVIKDLVSNQEIGSQDELMQQLSLNEIIVTQATLSRDLRELKISKLPNAKGEYLYKLTEVEPKFNSSDTETISFTHNLAVVKTQPGFATRIALEIDQAQSGEIIGTIAGDDTIFIALKENYDKEIIIQFTQKLLPKIQILS